MFAAVILAAGQSRRMLRPKMVLPWGDTTVVGQVARTLLAAGVGEVVAVTGGWREDVELALAGLPVRLAFNPRFAEDSMMLSLQVGLQALEDSPAQAVLVALGDQPQIEAAVAARLMAAYRADPFPLLIPSYQMRRGHPWMLAHPLWSEALTAPASVTLREFLNARASQIRYFPVETASILQDLDTPEDYARAAPSR